MARLAQWKARFASASTSSRGYSFNNLFLFDNWGGSIAAILCSLVILFLAFGLWWPYWRVADMDFWMVYEAWLFNDGLPQEWFDHPGYITILLLGQWFRVLHALGLLNAYALSSLPPQWQDAGGAWMAATQAGRVLSLILAVGYVLAFTALLRRITQDWRVSILAAFLLTFSGGLAMSARIMRTELIAGGAVTIALLLLIVAARSRASLWRPILVGLAAFLAVLGLINKIQVIYLACALPVLIAPFGVRADGEADVWRSSRFAIACALALFALAIVATIPASQLVIAGLQRAPEMAEWKPFLLNTYGAYQAMIAVWIAASIVAYGLWWGGSALETLSVLACVLTGVSLAFLLLDLRYNADNVVVIVNPLEQLFFWARASNAQISDISGLVRDVLAGLRNVALTRTFFFDTSARPTIFLEWFVVVATVLAWKAGHRKLVAQVAVLMLATWGMDTISAIRGLKQQYFILSDPFVIIAAALLLTEVRALQVHRWVFPVGVILMAVHVGISQAEPVKHTFLTGKPLAFCVDHFGYTKRIKRFPYCPAS